MARRKIQHIYRLASKWPGVRVHESTPVSSGKDLRQPLSAEEIIKLSKQKLFEDLKQILGSLPTKLSESEVIELTRTAWREAVVETVQDG